MMNDYTKVAMAYLDEAQPQAEPWTYEDARAWIDRAFEPEAKGLKAALKAVGIEG